MIPRGAKLLGQAARNPVVSRNTVVELTHELSRPLFQLAELRNDGYDVIHFDFPFHDLPPLAKIILGVRKVVIYLVILIIERKSAVSYYPISEQSYSVFEHDELK